jgi:hypothetical protein
LQFDDPLDKGLTRLLKDNAATKTGSAPAASDPVRMAVVDLSGDKICRPGLAGWGSTTPMNGGSTAKVAIVYAAHQAIFDLQQMAIDTSAGKAVIKKAADLKDFALKTAWSGFTCKPRIADIADIKDGAASAEVTMSAKLTRALSKLDDLGNMNSVLTWVGFEYLASLLWQSGLRHPTRNGLWFPNGYQADNPVAKDPACHADSDNIRHWKNDPLKEPRIMLTALSVATFYALMAQERLGDSATSRAIEAVIKNSGCSISGILPGALPSGAIRAMKCGLTSDLLHDSALIQHDKVRYVLVYLSKGLNLADSVLKKLYQDIDALVVARNP